MAASAGERSGPFFRLASSVRARLVLLAAAIAIPLILLSAAAVWYAYASERAQDEVELVGRAKAAAALIDREFEGSLSVLHVLGASKALSDGSVDAFEDEMRRAATALGGVLINLTSGTGEVLRSTAWERGTHLSGIQASDFVVGALRSNQASISNLFLGPRTGRMLIGIALPVSSGTQGKADWVLSLYPPARRIPDKLGDLNLPPESFVSIVDRNGIIVARNRDAASFVGRHPPSDMEAALNAGTSGLIKGDHRANDGMRTVAAFARAPVSGYAAIVAIPASVYFKPLETTLFWAGLGAALLTGLGFVGAVLASRGIVRGLHELAAAPPGTAPFTGFREIDEVGRTIAAADAFRRESEARLELATTAGDIGVWDWDLVAMSYVCSERSKAIMGFPPHRAVTLEMAQLVIHPDDRAHALQMRKWAFDMSATQPEPFEYRILRPDGAVRHVLVHGHRVTQAVDGVVRVIRYVGTMQDITHRKSAEATLIASQARLQLAIDAGRMATWEYDMNTGEMDGSPEMLQLLGLPRDEIPTPAQVQACSAPGEHERCLREMRTAKARGDRYFEVEHGFVTPAGRAHWLLLRAEFDYRDGLSARVVGVAMDISERKRAELRVRESEATLRELLATIDLAPVMIRGPGGKIRFWSRGCQNVYGWTAAEAVGRVAPELFKAVTPIPLDSINEAVARNGVWEGDVLHHHKDGTPLTISIHMALRQGAPGEEPAVLVNVRDVTALRKAEEGLRSLNHQLEERVRHEVAAREEAQTRAAQAERLQALGQLAGGIAHDFNNVLQAIGSGTSLIELQAKEPGRVQQIARRLQSAVERGASITRRLLVFSRRGDLKVEAVHPAALLEGLKDILLHTLGGAALVSLEVDPDVPDMVTDRRQLETMLVNLATNARDAMPGGGTIVLGACAHRISMANSRTPSLAAGTYVALTVTDTGTGMEPAIVSRATEPFFTTKAAGAGTGLGLATAQAFARQSGGALWIDSVLGEGTTVTMLLPTATATPSVEQPLALPARAAMAGLRVLVVDDDADVREALVTGLTAAGMQVQSAGSGDAAMARLQGGDPVDCLLTDLSMPGMNGVELIRTARHHHPGLPSIVLTGYADHDALTHEQADTPYVVLWKPADVAVISQRIQALVSA
jgi:PAS domain S-box-containing protein